MIAQVWPISTVRASTLVLIFSALLFSSQLALAQFTQQGPKLVGTGAAGPQVLQGTSVSLSADGNTAIVGGPADNPTSPNTSTGAIWVFTRSGGIWTQQGSKLVGTGAVGGADQGLSVSLSADGNTAIVGRAQDNYSGGNYGAPGAAWSSRGGSTSGVSRATSYSAPARLDSPIKASLSRCPATATPPSWAGITTTGASERCGSTPAATASGPSRAAS